MDKVVKKKQKFDLSLKPTPQKNDKLLAVPEINLIDDDSSRDAEDVYVNKESEVKRKNPQK